MMNVQKINYGIIVAKDEVIGGGSCAGDSKELSLSKSRD